MAGRPRSKVRPSLRVERQLKARASAPEPRQEASFRNSRSDWFARFVIIRGSRAVHSPREGGTHAFELDRPPAPLPSPMRGRETEPGNIGQRWKSPARMRLATTLS